MLALATLDHKALPLVERVDRKLHSPAVAARIGLVAQSLALALAHGFTTYDATYAALATRVGGTVVTNDGGMHRRDREAGLPVAVPDEIG